MVMKRLTLLMIAVFAGVPFLSAQDSTGLTQTTHIANILDNFNGLNSYFVAASIRPLENTVGSPYLYPDWGYLWIDSMANKPVKHSVVYDANLDMEKNMLIIKAGDGKAYTPETQDIQAFHLKKNDEVSYFVNMDLNNDRKFVQQLATGKYTLVKDTKVVFSRANFVDKGMTQSGHNYDEFKKEPRYYLIKDGVPVKVALKKKTFLAAVENDPAALQAAKKFLEGYRGPFDEMIATGFVKAVNK